eukprot:9152953-Alexandrium_andersonii.AAC.1
MSEEVSDGGLIILFSTRREASEVHELGELPDVGSSARSGRTEVRLDSVAPVHIEEGALRA